MLLYNEGKHRFYRGLHKCSRCHHTQSPNAVDLQRVGLWPAAPNLEHMQTCIDERTLRRWHHLKLQMPTCSMEGFAEVLDQQTEAWGNVQVGRVDRHVLQECYDQYCYMQHGLRYGPQEIDDLTCAACQDTPHSLHNDALMKGYTWQYRDGQPKQPWRVSGYGNRLFLSDNVILQHMEAVEVARNPHRHQAADDDEDGSSTAVCGGLWKAGQDRGIRHRNMHYTGRVFGTCRTSITCAQNLYCESC